MKKLIAVAFFAVAGYAANAQANSSASGTQIVEAELSNVIEVTFTGNGLVNGPSLNMEFGNVNDFANGVESAPQELRVRSNKGFQVAVKSNAANFSYTGNVTPAPVMPVSDVLLMKVGNNLTGGTVNAPFSSSTYYTIRDFNQTFLVDCESGDNRTFQVYYKATPGFAYPGGTYSVDVVYTATHQ